MDSKVIELILDIVGDGKPCSKSDWVSIRKALKDVKKTSTDTQQLTAKRCLNIAKGCHDYNGGHHGNVENEIYHHGIQTVINCLESFVKSNGIVDSQLKAVETIGQNQVKKEVPRVKPEDFKKIKSLLDEQKEDRENLEKIRKKYDLGCSVELRKGFMENENDFSELFSNGKCSAKYAEWLEVVAFVKKMEIDRLRKLVEKLEKIR